MNGNKFYGVMVNTYNHQLKQKYIMEVVANKAFAGNRYPGYQIKKSNSISNNSNGSVNPKTKYAGEAGDYEVRSFNQILESKWRSWRTKIKK